MKFCEQFCQVIQYLHKDSPPEAAPNGLQMAAEMKSVLVFDRTICRSIIKRNIRILSVPCSQAAVARVVLPGTAAGDALPGGTGGATGRHLPGAARGDAGHRGFQLPCYSGWVPQLISDRTRLSSLSAKSKALITDVALLTSSNEVRSLWWSQFVFMQGIMPFL